MQYGIVLYEPVTVPKRQQSGLNESTDYRVSWLSVQISALPVTGIILICKMVLINLHALKDWL